MGRLGAVSERVEQLNAILREFCEAHGIRWDPDQRDGIWVEERRGKLYVCDAGCAAGQSDPLTPEEATPEEIRRIAEVWLKAVRGS